MKVQTSRFGNLEVEATDIIQFGDGLLGFENLKRFFIVDPADDTLILWLQAVDSPEVAFPILEPKIFKQDYKVRLSANELRALQIDSVKKDILVYCILTIPNDITQMTANLKAPIVIHSRSQLARQVVLQENEYSVKNLIYKDLLAVIMSVANQGSKSSAEDAAGTATALSLKMATSKVEVVAL